MADYKQQMNDILAKGGSTSDAAYKSAEAARKAKILNTDWQAKINASKSQADKDAYTAVRGEKLDYLKAEDPLTAPPETIVDNSAQAKKAFIESQLAQLGMNYNSGLSNIENAYTKNLSNADQQKNLVANQYANIEGDVNQATFDALRYNKAMGSQRGITSSAQMLGADVSSQRAGNQQLFKAEQDKNTAVNNIQSFITQLGEAYGVDKTTLENNYGSAKLKAMSDGELMALESQLKVDMFNKEQLNQFSMADKTYAQNLNLNKINNEFTSGESEKARAFQTEQAALDRSFSKSQSAISQSNATSLQKQQQLRELNGEYMQNKMNRFINTGSLTNAQINSLESAMYSSMQSGDMSSFNSIANGIKIK